MYKNKPKPETKQAILARAKEEMDEPRMTESMGGEDVQQPTGQELEEVP